MAITWETCVEWASTSPGPVTGTVVVPDAPGTGTETWDVRTLTVPLTAEWAGPVLMFVYADYQAASGGRATPVISALRVPGVSLGLYDAFGGVADPGLTDAGWGFYEPGLGGSAPMQIEARPYPCDSGSAGVGQSIEIDYRHQPGLVPAGWCVVAVRLDGAGTRHPWYTRWNATHHFSIKDGAAADGLPLHPPSASSLSLRTLATTILGLPLDSPIGQELLATSYPDWPPIPERLFVGWGFRGSPGLAGISGPHELVGHAQAGVFGLTVTTTVPVLPESMLTVSVAGTADVVAGREFVGRRGCPPLHQAQRPGKADAHQDYAGPTTRQNLLFHRGLL